ncbi:MAG: sterol desaturase family protein [Polyangiales bacterium]
MTSPRALPWFGVMAFACALTWRAGALGLSPIAAYALTVTASQCLLVALERAMPLRAEWNRRDPQRAHDLGHYAISMALGQLAAGAVTSAIAWPLEDALVAALGETPWPARWPLAAQVALGCVGAEFGLYWQHRLMHSSRWLWRFHAVHHESPRLDVFKATRQHALDLSLATVAALVPLVALGASGAVMRWVGAISAALGLLQHANVAIETPRWLDAWVCTPATHRLHHSRDPREGATNFGVIVMLFDRLFGTWVAPARACPPAVGSRPHAGRSFAAELVGDLSK